MRDFIKGFDVSSLLEVERCGGKFYDFDGREGDLLAILAGCGGNFVRLRLWKDPFDAAGRPYGGGGCDLATVLTLARRAKAHGMGWLLDIAYSDFWADPGKQTLPKTWAGLSEEELEEAVYRYTAQVLTACREAEVPPQMVQVGNELTAGLLWPTGKTPHWTTLSRYLSAGVRAVRETLPETEVMIHLDNGGNRPLYRDWFDHFFAQGGDCDVIGMSYYPFWHGTLEDLEANMKEMALRHRKDIVLVEASSGFTLADYGPREGLTPQDRRGPAATAELAAKTPFPMTPAGQCEFTRTMFSFLRAVPEGRGRGLFWWEPGWIPVPGSGWAKEAGWRYVQEQGPGGNEWANQALFDFDGRALPALEVIRDA